MHYPGVGAGIITSHKCAGKTTKPCEMARWKQIDNVTHKGLNPFYTPTTNNYRECDDKCCSRMRLVGPFAGWRDFTKQQYHNGGLFIVNVRAISLLIVIVGGP